MRCAVKIAHTFIVGQMRDKTHSHSLKTNIQTFKTTKIEPPHSTHVVVRAAHTLLVCITPTMRSCVVISLRTRELREYNFESRSPLLTSDRWWRRVAQNAYVMTLFMKADAVRARPQHTCSISSRKRTNPNHHKTNRPGGSSSSSSRNGPQN